jgi:hypothetical protein
MSVMIFCRETFLFARRCGHLRRDKLITNDDNAAPALGGDSVNRPLTRHLRLIERLMARGLEPSQAQSALESLRHALKILRRSSG